MITPITEYMGNKTFHKLFDDIVFNCESECNRFRNEIRGFLPFSELFCINHYKSCENCRNWYEILKNWRDKNTSN